jgi:hypothetical protein
MPMGRKGIGGMKNRSKHYQEAVRLLDEADHVGHTDPERALGMAVAAGVHATLASIPDLSRLQVAEDLLKHDRD